MAVRDILKAAQSASHVVPVHKVRIISYGCALMLSIVYTSLMNNRPPRNTLSNPPGSGTAFVACWPFRPTAPLVFH